MPEKVRKLESDTEFLEVFQDEGDPNPAIPQVEDVLSVKLDASAPNGEKTVCAVCHANLIYEMLINTEFSKNYLLRMFISKYKALDKLIKIHANRKGKNWHDPEYERYFGTQDRGGVLDKVKFSLKCLGVKAELDEKYQTEWKNLQTSLSSIREEILKNSLEIYFTPTSKLKIHNRNGDGRLKGEVVILRGKPLANGSFVTVMKDAWVQYQILPFFLGIKEDCILAACSEHIDELQNIRLQTKQVKDRYDPKKKWWIFDKLYAQIFENAEERLRGLKINAEQKGAEAEQNKATISQWTEGEELKKILDQEPDRTFRYTARAIALRKNSISGEWEILFVTELGDQIAFNSNGGKPPGIGCPGGMVEGNETIGQTLFRETKNESQCGNVKKVIALVSQNLKASKPNSKKRNIDLWFLIETSSEYYLSENLIESQEIKANSARWVPLSELATFTFQNSNCPELDPEKVERQKMLYRGHAARLAEILPRIPWLVLPENFSQFQKNIEKFKEKLRS